MIVTDSLVYIPFTALTRVQVAELMGKSVSAVDYYVKRGTKLSEGHIIYLQKQRNGTFFTKDVIKFINTVKK